MRRESREEEGRTPSCGDAVSFLKKPSASWRRKKSFLLVKNRLNSHERQAFAHPEKGNAISVCHLSHTSNWAGKVAQCMGQQTYAPLWKCCLPWLVWTLPSGVVQWVSLESPVQCIWKAQGAHRLYIATYLPLLPPHKKVFTTQSRDKYKTIKCIFICQQTFRQQKCLIAMFFKKSNIWE